MAYIPEFVKLSQLKTDTLNAIGTDIGVGVTVLTNDLATLHEYGNTVLGATVLQNSFCSALMNRIARVIFTSNSYRNPLKLFKKGVLSYGEMIEDVFVEIAKGVQRNENATVPTVPYTTANAIPDVKTAFYMSNLRARYDVCIRRPDLEKAFLTFEGVQELVEKIIDSLASGADFDEFILTKFKMQQAIINDNVSKVSVTLGTDVKAYAEDILTAMRAGVGHFKFMSTDYNISGVLTSSKNDNLVAILPVDTESVVDVKALASAFNLSYADFIGRRVNVDDFTFSDSEIERFESITGLTYSEIMNADKVATIKNCVAITCDSDVFQIYDTKEPYMTEDYNGADDVRIYHLHVDKVFALSPFKDIQIYNKVENGG